MSSGGGVAAWVYDSIIHSDLNRWGMDVHCIVGVLGSATTRYDSVITRSRGGLVGQTLLTDPQGL